VRVLACFQRQLSYPFPRATSRGHNSAKATLFNRNMPPKGANKSRNKTNHRRGGPKYVMNADEIEARNANEEPKKDAEGSDDDIEFDDDLGGDDGVVFDRTPMPPPPPDAAAEDGEGEETKPKKGGFKTSNPNDVKVKNIKLKDMNTALADKDESQMTRKERDEAEAQRKKEAYQKLHKEGKTDEFKKDMERLKEIKERRERQEAQKKALEETNARAAEAAQRAAARANDEAPDEDSDEEGVEKLDAREVKGMNPKQLKEHLKSRGLSIQGSKKDLINRLVEAAC